MAGRAVRFRFTVRLSQDEHQGGVQQQGLGPLRPGLPDPARRSPHHGKRLGPDRYHRDHRVALGRYVRTPGVLQPDESQNGQDFRGCVRVGHADW